VAFELALKELFELLTERHRRRKYLPIPREMAERSGMHPEFMQSPQFQKGGFAMFEIASWVVCVRAIKHLLPTEEDI
jgi:hypothetical protein